jgi:hypothetical protein
MSRLVDDQRRGDARGKLNAGVPETPKERLENYLERVAKFVPVEIIAAFIAIRGWTPTSGTPQGWPPGLEAGIYFALVIATPIYFWKLGGGVPRKGLQCLISTISFIVWSYGIGGPFFWKAFGSLVSHQVEYQGFGAAVVVLWALALGLFKPGGK